jgi:hypothetical protein
MTAFRTIRRCFVNRNLFFSSGLWRFTRSAFHLQSRAKPSYERSPRSQPKHTMKTKLNVFFASAGLLAAGTLTSCTTNVTPASPTTGTATTSTTTQQAYPYSGTSTTSRKTTTTQY